MRGFLHINCLLFAAVLLAAPQTRVAAQDTGWRSTGSHSTIDRTTIDRSQAAKNNPQPDLFEGETYSALRAESPNEGTSPDEQLLRTAQSPEVAPIVSPIEPQPMLESYFPPEVGAGQPYPGFVDETDMWFTLQSASATVTWLPPPGDNDIGWADLDLRTKLGFSSHYLQNLTVTPGVQMHLVDGPTQTDLPERLYNTQVEFRWKQQVSLPLWFEVAATPGVYSDFDQSSSSAFRMKAQGLVFFAFSRETQVVAGLYYLDRFDIDFLPIFGLIHSPREDIKLNLVFPAPKIAKRVWQGACQDEWWLYLSGEFGGGSWAVERVPGVLPGGGMNDQIAYRDWRIILGLERKVGEGTAMFFETGVVFNRQLEYESGVGDFDPDNTAMLRAGFTY